MHGSFILEIISILLAAVIIVPLSQLLKLGAVPGFLLSGILIGPSAMGLVSNVESISHISEFGVVLLLFVIGTEMKPAFLWKIKTLVFGLGSLQILLSALAIASVSFLLFSIDITSAVVIGAALALSSTAFVLQILKDKKQLTSDTGQSSLAILLMQDLAVVPLLALIPLLASSNSVTGSLGGAIFQSVAILAFVLLTGRYLLNPILHIIAKSANSEIFTAVAVLIVIGTAYLTELAGLSMAMGAFLAGLLISDSAYRHQIKAEIQPFRGLLLGAFFVSMGMSLNLNVLFSNPLLLIGATVLLIGLKVLVLTPLVKIFGLSWKKSLSVGLLLGQGGEFALVLFALAFNQQILAQTLFEQLMLIVLLSMLVTPLLASLSFRLQLNDKVETIGTNSDLATPSSAENPIQGRVVIAGFGRVGRAVAEVLANAQIPYIAFDKSANIVKKHKAQHPVFFGDVTQSSLLNSGGISEASSVIITVNSPDDAQELVSTIRLAQPDLPLYVRGHNSDICKKLYKLGANRVISENIEVSLELSEQVLVDFGIDEITAEQQLTAFRQNYYKKIRNSTDTI